MVPTSAEELQARLALRALWSPTQAGSCPEDTTSVDDSAPSRSTFHRQMRAEVDEVLKASLSRRVGRLQKKVGRLIEASTNGSVGQENISPKSAANGSSPSGAPSVSVSEMEVQTNVTGQTVPPNLLAEKFEKAFTHAIRSTWAPTKKWGPSRRQNNYQDPPEKEEKLEKEATTLRNTLSCLNQNIPNRERQIASLKGQLAVVKIHVKQEEEKVAERDEILRAVKDPSKLVSVHATHMKNQKQEVEDLDRELVSAKAEAKRYQALVKQQHAFFMQADTIYCRSGVGRLHRFPSGEVFLVPQPLPMDDDKAESWDVGTSIANPYEVDSWPFEPNVLARRSPKECPMDNVPEETLEDLLEAQRPGRTNPFRGHGLNLRNLSNEDGDGDGPTATSRSL